MMMMMSHAFLFILCSGRVATVNSDQGRIKGSCGLRLPGSRADICLTQSVSHCLLSLLFNWLARPPHSS